MTTTEQMKRKALRKTDKAMNTQGKGDKAQPSEHIRKTRLTSRDKHHIVYSEEEEN